MPSHPLRLTRTALFSASDLAQIEETALRILEEVGIQIQHSDLSQTAHRRGFRETHGRFRLPRATVKAFVDEARSAERVPRRQPARSEKPALTLSPSYYPLAVHDPATDEIVPFTTPKLIEATKLVAMLGDRGLALQVPGYPADVPAPLQAVRQFHLGAEILPGGCSTDAKSVEPLRYIMEMSEVLGRPIRGLPVYVFSPLKLAGESLSAVLTFRSRLDHISVASMPAAGSTAPVLPAEAFALAAAEVIGSALILRDCLELPVSWYVTAHPFDLRGLAMSFGSPEALLFEMASNEVNAFFHREPWWQAAGNLNTLAKLPGPQAAAEKAAIMSLGALLGGRHFTGAGNLSLDEVFSPIQLLVDLEIKDHVERLARGLDSQCDPDACLEDVRLAAERGFVGLDRTLDRYRALYWHPLLFERRFLGPWQAASCPKLQAEAWDIARQLIARHDYEAPPHVMSELDRIYRAAERDLVAG